MKRTIKAWRKASEITQVEMAKKLGISTYTYMKYENRPERISIGMMNRILDILKVDINDIFLASNFSVREIEE